ncbi:hypothetical protein BR93DRAFT_319369 [Coniochaeta sp. PMI_546]|nr:hypothetical protein BR93DRAFT_319369 [Coniochaeta sp. PMI_546]
MVGYCSLCTCGIMSGTSFQLATVSFGPFKADIWPLVGRILTLDEHNGKPIHPCVLSRGKETPILQATRRKLPPFRRLAKLFVSENRESTCAITLLPYWVTHTQSVLHSTRCPNLRGAQGLESRPVHGALCCGRKREALEGMRLKGVTPDIPSIGSRGYQATAYVCQRRCLSSGTSRGLLLEREMSLDLPL